MKLYLKIHLIISLLIGSIFFYEGRYSNILLKSETTYDRYDVNFISNFNKLNPKHWLVLLSNNNYQNLYHSIYNALILSKNSNKDLATYFAVLNLNKLQIEDQNKIFYLLTK